jgi:hypothetical protein
VVHASSVPVTAGPGLPLEAEILLCAARSRRPPAGADRLPGLLRSGPDWEALLRSARRLEVEPLLYRSLRAVPLADAPAAVLERLQRAAYATAAHNLFLTTELLRLLRLFRARGLLAVPFKGPVLGASAYGSPALRTFVDLDVLVAGRDVPPARRILEQAGYRPRLTLTGFQWHAYLQSECSLDYVDRAGRATVELHWGLMPHYFGLPLRLDDLRGRLQTVPLGGAAVPSLGAEDLLLFLCLHGTKHRWASLKWVCDVAELLAAVGPLDWEGVTRRATALGGRRMLHLGLFLAASLLQAPLPPAVAQALRRDTTVAELAAEVGAALFGPPVARPGAGNRFYLRAMTSPWRRARYLLHLATIPTTEDWELLPLPPAASILYYPLHALRLLGRAVRLAGAVGAPPASAVSRRTAPARLPTVKA